jgi:hypothetical protein
MSTWEYVLAGAGMIFSSVGFWTFIQRILDKRSDHRMMVLGLTYLGIKMSCKSVMERGWVSVEELEDLEKYLYEPYKRMGGNGTAEAMLQKVKQLPNKPQKEVKDND